MTMAVRVSSSASLRRGRRQRRTAEDALPEPRAQATCDVLAQDCKTDGLTCYLTGPGVCALSRNVPEGGRCDSMYSCAPGLDCVSGKSAPNDYVCMPYCNAVDPAGEGGCGRVCTVNYLLIQDAEGKTEGGICVPE